MDNVKRLFWAALAATRLVACGGSPAVPAAEPSGRGSISPLPVPAPSGAAVVSARASASASVPTEVRASGPAARCRPWDGNGGLAIRCDPDRVIPPGLLLYHPDRATPPRPQRAALDAVADLMHQQQEILLLRIEVRCHAPAPDATGRRRAMRRAQRRADAVLSYLWRRRGVSAERMEAVGLSAGATDETNRDWSLDLRILQWAPDPPGRSARPDDEGGQDQTVLP